MKSLLLALMIFAFCCFPVAGQTAATKDAAPAALDVAAEKNAPVIAREKFDPAKDPAADLQKAVIQASAEGKRIILDIGGEWCVWCRYMDRFISLNPELDKLRTNNFVWLKVNMSEENENKIFLSAYPAIEGYPHFFILDEKGKLLQSQDTSILEDDKTYSLERFTAFFKLWAPKKKTAAAK